MACQSRKPAAASDQLSAFSFVASRNEARFYGPVRGKTRPIPGAYAVTGKGDPPRRGSEKPRTGGRVPRDRAGFLAACAAGKPACPSMRMPQSLPDARRFPRAPQQAAFSAGGPVAGTASFSRRRKRFLPNKAGGDAHAVALNSAGPVMAVGLWKLRYKRSPPAVKNRILRRICLVDSLPPRERHASFRRPEGASRSVSRSAQGVRIRPFWRGIPMG